MYLRGREFTREKVRVRDNHTCQDCKSKWVEGNRRFDVHHLNNLCGKLSRSYDKLDTLNTMVTLCHKCHFNRPEHRVKSQEFLDKKNLRAIAQRVPKDATREREICELRAKKLKLREIASIYNITGERVRQICKRNKQSKGIIHSIHR